ncbi:MAG: nucleotidyltransferase domain-containing protein [Candidatus Helarchaeota archaeon]
MCQLCKKNIIPNKDINRKVIKLIHKIKEQLNPRKIILYGSLIRGDIHELSDVDLVIVGKYDIPFFQRIGLVLDLNDSDLEVEPLVYNEQEFAKMLESGNFFITYILEKGIDVLS